MEEIKRFLTNGWVVYGVWLLLWVPVSDMLLAMVYVWLLWYIDDGIPLTLFEPASNIKYIVGVLVILWSCLIVTLPWHGNLLLILIDNVLLGISYYMLLKEEK